MKPLMFVLAFALLAMPACRADSGAAAKNTETLTITRADGTSHQFDVEMAVTPETRTIGLMFRKSMPADHGMLFVFEKEEPMSFWMRNTLIPLDMVFIRKDGTIESIYADAIPHDERPHRSQGPVIAVLEINGGRAAALNIRAGDVVLHETFGNALAQ